MGEFASLKEAQEYFVHDRFAAVNGMRVTAIGAGTASAAVDITADHRNAYGGVMGGAITTLADLAFAACANNIHRTTVAQQMSVNFLSGSKGNRLTADARCIKNGRTSVVIDITVTDDTGRAIAQIVGTGFKL